MSRLLTLDDFSAARTAGVAYRIARSKVDLYIHTSGVTMKKILELILCILHPVAVVLIWINLLFGRGSFSLLARLTWAVAVIVPFVPFVFVLTGNDFL
jgi:hypothetical protein